MAELRLDVTLNLTGFRTQLAKITNIAQSEFAPKINVRFNRELLNTELNNLQKAIKRRVYRIEIAGNIDSFPSKIAAIREGLSLLETQNKIAIPVGVRNGVTKKDATAVVAAAYRTIRESALENTGGKIRIPVSIKPSITKKDVADFKKAVKDSLSGISVNVKANIQGGGFAGSAEGAAGLMEYMKKEGMIGKTASGMTMSMRNKPASGSGFRSLPEGASQAGAGVEFSEMMRRFRGEIAALTTQPKKYEQLLNALPDRRITTDLADVASRRSRAAEMPSFMPIQQKLGPGELEKQIISDLAQYIKSIRIPNPWVGPTGDYQKFIGNISRATRQLTSQALLPSAKAVKLLPPGSSSTFQQTVAARTQIAYQRSAARSATVLGGPSGPTGGGGGGGGGGLPPGGGATPAGGGNAPVGGGGGAPPRGGGGAFAGMQFAMPKLPRSGIVQELGTEFSFAAKQVLLFGAAYKALAFLTDFPSKVGEAVGQLQSFRNTIKAISPTANEAAQSSQFILDVVDKYNVPLQSARDGFTKLYASMQPAGFNGGEIRDLFLGISQAAATFGMSADKVDRVNYAFAQMASKGQIMSEELKGQLGDVLPGAMAIFAEAAGFKGKNAIVDFSKALEDGAYKGGAMKTLLTNVGTIMSKEFGPGAEGAARTFQGSMNRMQNSLTLFYETFEPVAVGFLNSVVTPITGGLKTITEGIKAYSAGQIAATPEAENFSNVLKTLVPSLGGIAQNIGFALKQLLPLAQIIGAVAVQVSRFLALPFIGYLAGTYLQVVLLTSGFQLLATSGLGLAIAATIQFIRQGITAASVMTGLQVATQQTTFATFQFGRTLQTVMIKSVVGIALVAIGALIAKIMELRGQLSAIGNDARGMESLAKSSAKMGDVQGTKEALGNIKDRLSTFKELQKELKNAKKTTSGGSTFSDRGAISDSYQISSNTAKKLVELGVLNAKVLTKTSTGYSVLATEMGTVNSLVNKNVDEFEKAGQKGNILIDQAIKKSKTQKTGLENINLSEDDKTKKINLESYASLEDQLAKDFTQAQIDRLETEHQHKVDLINAEYDLKEAKANSFQKEALKFERRMVQIDMERQGALLKASSSVLAAQGSVAGGAGGGGGIATGGVVATTGGALSQDPVTRGSSTGAHLHAQAANMTENTLRYLVDKYLEIGGKTATSFGQSRGSAGHGYNAIDFLTPQNTPVKLKAGASMSQYGPAGGRGGLMGQVSTPEGNFQLGHLTSLTSAQGVDPGPKRKVLGSEKRDLVAQQKVQIELSRQSDTVRQQEIKSLKDAEIALANFVAAATPVNEQKLQNSLLERKTDLMIKGYSNEVIDRSLKFYEAEYNVNEGIAVNKRLLDAKIISQAQADRNTKTMTENLQNYNVALNENTTQLSKNKFAQTMGSLRNRLAIAQAPTEDAARREALKQENYTEQEIPEIMAAEKTLAQLEELKQKANDTASFIGSSFSKALKDVALETGVTKQAFATLFQDIGDYFLDMILKMIADAVKLQIVQGLQNIFSMFGPSLPGAAAPTPTPPMLGPAFAKGGIAFGGFTAFASGGIVTGPTLGLVGEGRYNEAIIPLPDGRSVPVELGGAAAGAATNNVTSNIVVNVNSDGQSTSNANGSNSVDLGRKIEGAVKQVIVAELRPGGVLAGRR